MAMRYHLPSMLIIATLALLLAAALPSTVLADLPASAFPITDSDTIIFENDDQSSDEIPLGGTINFYGVSYTSLWTNNNGELTFQGPFSTFTPVGFTGSEFPMIAPFWGDADTRGAGVDSNGRPQRVFYRVSRTSSDITKATNIIRSNFPAAATFNPTFTVVATWNRVGYFNQHYDKLNHFQAMLASDTSSGVAYACFYYGQLEWTTGDASSGSGGLGGFPAVAGFSDGNGNFLNLPGSATAAVLNLNTYSNLLHPEPGVSCFQINTNVITAAPTPAPKGTAPTPAPTPAPIPAPTPGTPDGICTGSSPTPTGLFVIRDKQSRYGPPTTAEASCFAHGGKLHKVTNNGQLAVTKLLQECGATNPWVNGAPHFPTGTPKMCLYYKPTTIPPCKANGAGCGTGIKATVPSPDCNVLRAVLCEFL